MLNEFSIDDIATPFLSAGIISVEELSFLRSNNNSARMESWQFVKMILHRGDEAIKIFLQALENKSISSKLLEEKEISNICEGMNNTNILNNI